jgi:3-methyladenine DNA glycosylase AlkD
MKLHEQIIHDLKAKSSPEKAKSMSRYFKTGVGDYGEGDLFLGVSVPDQRIIVKRYSSHADTKTVSYLLDSKYHEVRLTGVLLAVACFTTSLKDNKAGATKKRPTTNQWLKLYLGKTNRINNWDLVDSSAPGILGKWLEDKERTILYRLAKSKCLWENRIAMVATLHFIRQNDFKDVFKLSKIFIKHPHDLMHKATGWMLREAWKKDATKVEEFLWEHKNSMPRTMLRYAIEKMPVAARKKMMAK